MTQGLKSPLPATGPFFWGGSRMPTHKGPKCSLWGQTSEFHVFEAGGGPGGHLPAERGGCGHQVGPILQIPQLCPLLPVFPGRWGLEGVCLTSAHSPPLHSEKECPAWDYFCGSPSSCFLPSLKSMVHWLVVLKINSESFYLRLIKSPYPALLNGSLPRLDLV